MLFVGKLVLVDLECVVLMLECGVEVGLFDVVY